MSFSVVAKVAKTKFALDEAVPLEVSAVNTSSGLRGAPVIEGPDSTVALLVSKDGGPAAMHEPQRDLGLRPALPVLVAEQQRAHGVIDVKHLAGRLAAGSYEVTALLLDTGDRSKPVRFEVERAVLRAAAAVPVTGSGDDERQVLRLEARASGAQLVLVRPVQGHDEVEREAIDLGPAPATATIALSSSAPPERDERAWALALDGARLARRFADRGLGGHTLPELTVPAEDARLVGAVAGELETPAPPPSFTRGVDVDPWPWLHVALIGRAPGSAAGADLQLMGLDVGPGSSSSPTWHRLPLGAAPAAARVSALDAATRYVFVASPADGERVRIEAIAWRRTGFAKPLLLLETRGALLDMEAVVDADGTSARVHVLVALPDGARAIESARIDAAGAVARSGARVFTREQLPSDMEQLRLRAAWEDDVYLLARTSAGEPILVLPGSITPWPAPVPRGAWWDIEIVAGSIHALHVAEERGLVVELIEPPEEP